MSARDKIHQAVKNALIKDGWTITADPLQVDYKDVHLQIDLAAEKVLAAERNGEKIAVEIKSFLSVSTITDLKQALGTFNLYLAYLPIVKLGHTLWLAISNTTFDEIFSIEGIEVVFQINKIPLLVVNVETEEIAKWISKLTTKI